MHRHPARPCRHPRGRSRASAGRRAALPAGDHIAQCLDAKPGSPKPNRKTINELRFAGDACQKAHAALVELRAAPAPSSQPKLDAVAVEALKARQDANSREVPAFMLGESSWSLTVQAFLGLTRVTFGNRTAGTTDQFAPLSGLGSGMKLRYNYVATDDKVRELVGLSWGLYFEPKVPVNAATGGDTTAQTLSAMLVLSTFEYLYLGFGLKFASTESAFDRGFAARNFMLVFGLGADGKSFTN